MGMYVCLCKLICTICMQVYMESRLCQVHWDWRHVGCKSPTMGAGNLGSLYDQYVLLTTKPYLEISSNPFYLKAFIFWLGFQVNV